MMKIPGSKNIYFKLIIYSLLSSLIFIGISVAFFSKTETEFSIQKATNVANQLIDMVETSAASAMYSNNARAAQEIAEGLLRHPLIDKVTIYNEQELRVEKVKAFSAPPPIEISRRLFSPFDKNILIGHVVIAVNTEIALSQVYDTVLIYSFNAIGVIILIMLVLLLIIKLCFLKPLVHISNALQDVVNSGGEYIPTLNNHSSDELGFLIEKINQILEQLTLRLSTQQVLRKQIEAEEKKLRNIFESTSAGLFLLDNEGNILICTPTLKQIVDYDESEEEDDGQAATLEGKNFARLFFNEPMQFEQMLKNALEFGQLEAQDFLLKSTRAEPLWVHCLVSKIVEATGFVRFEGVMFDISRRVAAEKAMHYEINHDPLTGLLRRNAAEQRLKKHLVSANCSGAVVMLLDLDGFKKANDTYGHHAGDIVLTKTAKRLESSIRRDDIACRLGGDEFLIVLWDCSSVPVSFTIAEKIIAAVKEPVQIDSQTQVQVGVSIGIALFPAHGISVKSLLSSADEAMYEVKRQGKNGYGIKNKDGSIVVTRPKMG